LASKARGGFWYANALRESELPPHARHIGHVLASVANSETGRIRVSLTWLERATGLSRSTVAKYLNTLESEGWVRRQRAPVHRQIQDHEATSYTTTIPNGFPVSASPSHGLGLVRESETASPSHGPSTTSTKADAASARGASAGAAATNAHSMPRKYGAACECPPPVKTADGDCIACGGSAA
jgi:hypothetical protein